MRDIWFISDTHFGHANILTFTRPDGSLVRPGFKDVNHMDTFMIEQWNAKVKPGDIVYHLGDFTFKPSNAPKLLKSLNGRKRLIVGNHDSIKHIAPYFQKVSLWRPFPDFDFVCSHVPLREGQFPRNVTNNVHGHIHQNLIKAPNYINVCVEHTNYAPVHLEDIRARINRNVVCITPRTNKDVT